MTEEQKTWYFIDEEGNAAPFGGGEPTINPGEEIFKKVYVTNCPFNLEQEDKAGTGRDMGSRCYDFIPADCEIAKYVVEHGVEVER